MKNIHNFPFRYLLIILLLGITISLSAKNDNPVKSVYDLIERVTPGYSTQFSLELIEKKSADVEYFQISGKGKKVKITGNTKIALSTGYHYYLKKYCNVHISWLGSNIALPEKLPIPSKTEKIDIQGIYRVYLNYCTVNYTASWWDWERWQREIDFMAMNAINTPLSVVGLEAVWYNTLQRFGFTESEARDFLVGPAYFAWQWMTNIQSYGGSLPVSWIDQHAALGKQIIDRQLELGMRPIQQGFSGFVPRELKRKYPQTKIQYSPDWCGFRGTAQLDPLDSLFNEIGSAFLEEQDKLFGSHGFYAADPFHEGEPPVDSPEYLRQVGQNIYKLFKGHDTDATWVMQAWSIREDIATSVSKDDLLILDLNGSRWKKDKFWGYNFVVGNLHNFGGRINLHGDLKLLASNQYQEALAETGTAVGSGLFMEAIEQNPVYYELAFEMPLHAAKPDLSEWLSNYATRRYGKYSQSASQAWIKMLSGPYREGTNGVENSSIICARPAVNVKKSGPNAGFDIPYNPQDLIAIQELLLTDGEQLQYAQGYRFDIMDIQRQIMSNLGQEIHKKAMEGYNKRDYTAFKLHTSRFLELLQHTDRLLNTRREYSFYRWVSSARSWGTNGQESDLYEFNAKSLVSIWGADGDPVIFDYSWREWAGLIKTYYYPRWQSFYNMLEQTLLNGTIYSEEGLPQVYGRETFRANEFYSALALQELSWLYTQIDIPEPSKEDTYNLTLVLFDKYKELAKEYY